MSTSTEIARLQQARNLIRNKMVALGLGETIDKLDDLATEIDSISNRGAVSATVKEGETYTIPEGYHNGSGTVQGVAGGGNYTLQAKSVTPTKSQQSITPDSGYYGLSSVTVAVIPEAYQDVTSVTAGEADVLANKVIVDASGATVAGTMPNNGKVDRTLDTSNTSYTIAKGYHGGTGTVKIVPENKTATPTKATQNIVPTSGKVLSKVTVNPIPSDYIVTADADATAGQILAEATAYVDGAKVTGTMPNNGATSATMDGLTTTFVTIPAGYTSGGSVSLTNDIEQALAAI